MKKKIKIQSLLEGRTSSFTYNDMTIKLSAPNDEQIEIEVQSGMDIALGTLRKMVGQ